MIVLFILVVSSLCYWLLSPLFKDQVVSEAPIISPSTRELENEPTRQVVSEPKIVAQGKFTGADGFHKAEGVASIIKIGDKYSVRLEDDFKVTNGPDLYVYFGKNGAYDPSAKIAVLKGNVGGQNYEVPASLNALDYNEIWIWCRAFSVPFGSARLEVK